MKVLGKKLIVFAPTYPFYFMAFFQGITILP